MPYTVSTLFLSLYVYLALYSPPKLKDVYNIVTPDYAAQWKAIGTFLGISEGCLDRIEMSFPANAFWCCDKMLKVWLEIVTSASKLVLVIDFHALMAASVYSVITSTYVVHPIIASDTGK